MMPDGLYYKGKYSVKQGGPVRMMQSLKAKRRKPEDPSREVGDGEQETDINITPHYTTSHCTASHHRMLLGDYLLSL